jgi:hypothetical protein
MKMQRKLYWVSSMKGNHFKQRLEGQHDSCAHCISGFENEIRAASTEHNNSEGYYGTYAGTRLGGRRVQKNKATLSPPLIDPILKKAKEVGKCWKDNENRVEGGCEHYLYYQEVLSSVGRVNP